MTTVEPAPEQALKQAGKLIDRLSFRDSRRNLGDVIALLEGVHDSPITDEEPWRTGRADIIRARREKAKKLLSTGVRQWENHAEEQLKHNNPDPAVVINALASISDLRERLYLLPAEQQQRVKQSESRLLEKYIKSLNPDERRALKSKLEEAGG